MKKLQLLTLSLLTFIFLSTACSKKDEDKPQPTPEPTESNVWAVFIEGSSDSEISIEVIEYGNKRFCYEGDECISVENQLSQFYTVFAGQELLLVYSEQDKIPTSVSLNNLNITEGAGTMRLAVGKFATVDGERTFQESETLYTSPELVGGYIYSFKY